MIPSMIIMIPFWVKQTVGFNKFYFLIVVILQTAVFYKMLMLQFRQRVNRKKKSQSQPKKLETCPQYFQQEIKLQLTWVLFSEFSFLYIPIPVTVTNSKNRSSRIKENCLNRSWWLNLHPKRGIKCGCYCRYVPR